MCTLKNILLQRDEKQRENRQTASAAGQAPKSQRFPPSPVQVSGPGEEKTEDIRKLKTQGKM